MSGCSCCCSSSSALVNPTRTAGVSCSCELCRKAARSSCAGAMLIFSVELSIWLCPPNAPLAGGRATPAAGKPYMRCGTSHSSHSSRAQSSAGISLSLTASPPQLHHQLCSAPPGVTSAAAGEGEWRGVGAVSRGQRLPTFRSLVRPPLTVLGSHVGEGMDDDWSVCVCVCVCVCR